MSPPPTRRLAALVGAGAALVFLALFRDAAFFGRLPHDVVATNDVSFVGAVFEQWAAQVREGTVPLWFPEFDCGTPLAAAWMYGLLYPGLLLFVWLPLGAAWAWTAALHAALGAAGMATFLRRRGCDVPGAVAGAALFAVSEYFVGRTECGHLNLVLPVAWAPWVLVGIDACVRGERRGVPFLAFATGAGLLAGHVQMWVYLAPLAAAFGVVEAWGARDRGVVLRRLAAAAAIGLGVAAAQVAITVEFLAQAAPIAEDPAIVRAVSVPPGVLLLKLLGGFAGPAPAGGDLDFRHEFRGIAGLWAFGLAVWGFRRGAPRRWFWLAAALLGLVAAVGTRSAATAWIQDVPPFSLARAPGRFLVVPLVAVSVLAGHGVSALPWAGLRRDAAAAAVVLLALVAGVPGVASVSRALHETDWSERLPAEFRAHRVHSPPLYQWSNVERSGLATLRTPCYVRTRGYAELMAQPSPAIAWWLDVGAELEPLVRPGAGDTPTLEDIVRTEVAPYEAMGRARFFATAVRGVPDAAVAERLRRGERALFLDPGDADAGADTDARAACRVVAWTPRRITVEVDSTGPGWVLVSTRRHPGWSATSGGERVQVHRGNLAFPAVRVPSAGRHVVEFVYAPASFLAGAAVSIASLAAVVILLVRSSRGAVSSAR